MTQEEKTLSRFFSFVEVIPRGCWFWKGAKNGARGYGMFWNNGQMQVAHRYLYEAINGAVPIGFELDHLCRNKSCVNPNHLEIVTRQENTKRGLLPAIMRAKRKDATHCCKGHPYTEENTYHYTTKQGYKVRYCRQCHCIHSKESRLRRV